MSFYISSSVWNASNIPIGITLDPELGIFSGTTRAEAGEYVVPVSVTTNYGSDSKDVKFIVQRTYGVYAIGYMAATWSKDAEPDELGFRPLDVPKATLLQHNHSGFVAYLPSTAYYYCGAYGLQYYATNPTTNMLLTQDSPYYNGQVGRFMFIFYPVESHNDTPTSSNVRQHFYVALRSYYDDSLGVYTSGRWGENGGSTNLYANSSAFSKSFGGSGNAIILPELFNPSIKFFSNSKGIRWLSDSGYKVSSLKLTQPSKSSMNVTATVNSSELGYRAVKIFDASYFSFLSEDMSLDGTAANFPFGNIKDAWFLGKIGYVLNENNDLYMFDEDSEGLWSFLGNWNIKKLQIPAPASSNDDFKQTAIFLTDDGQLFHKGPALEGICEAHDSFSPIFDELYVADFTLSSWRFLIPKAKYSTLTILK